MIGVPEAPSAEYYLSKARQCFRLADATIDREVATQLRELGYEFIDQALAAGADPASFPETWRRRKP